MTEIDISSLDYTDKLNFLAEWYDYEMSFLKKFYFHFYPFDNSVELYDRELNRVYLRRALCEGVSLKDMFVGNMVRVYGRQVQLTDYADLATKKLISKKNERTLAIIKPTVVKEFGPILDVLLQNQFKVMKLKMCELTRNEALEFYESKKSDSFLPFLVDQIISGPIMAMEIIGENAVAKWKTLIGPADPSVARKVAPESLRAIYGQELATNGFHGPDNDEGVLKESRFFFPKATDRRTAPSSTAKFKNSTCCVIKPHAIDAGNIGLILNEIINSQFFITAIEMFYLSNANADEFLEVYKGVVGDFNALHLSFIDGPCVAIEVSAKGDCNAHEEFRKFVGPCDPDVARQIRPDTLRAKYGVDKYRNAVHCTDLPEDTSLELEYFFRILQD